MSRGRGGPEAVGREPASMRLIARSSLETPLLLYGTMAAGTVLENFIRVLSPRGATGVGQAGQSPPVSRSLRGILEQEEENSSVTLVEAWLRSKKNLLEGAAAKTAQFQHRLV